MADESAVSKLIQDATRKMNGRKRTDDFRDLIAVAAGAIAKALDDGNGKHPPGSWMSETYGGQITHMQEHLGALMVPPRERAAKDDEDHLAHLICRAVIARALKGRPAK